MALSIVDFFPSLGQFVAKNRQAAQQAAFDQSAPRVQSLLGNEEQITQAGSQGLTGGPEGLSGLGDIQTQAPRGLLADPTSASNQLKFALGLMATPGYGQLGSNIAQNALTNQLGLPMEQMKFAQQQRNDRETSLTKNLQAQGLVPGTPEFQLGVQDYLRKTASSTVNVNNIPQGSLDAAAFANESAQAGIAYNEQFAGTQGQDGRPGQAAYVPSFFDQSLAELPFGIGNYAVTPEYQEFIAVSDAWIQANLRPVSGAVLGVEEIANFRETHFPVAGDSDATLEQKRLLRAQKEQSQLTRAKNAQGEIQAVAAPARAEATPVTTPQLDPTTGLLPGFEPIRVPQLTGQKPQAGRGRGGS